MISQKNQQTQTKLNQSYTNAQENRNYVPFLMKSNRFSDYIEKTSPPIGSYNLPSCFDRKKSPLQDRISHFLVQAQKKKQQMCIFKSSKNRFQKIVNQGPGPSSYNLFRKQQSIKQQKMKVVTNKQNILVPKTCPSIPFKNNKYGYTLQQGQIKSIQKDETQIEKQKQSRKIYVSTLEGQIINNRQQNIKRCYDTDYKKRLYDSTEKLIFKKNNQQLTQNNRQNSVVLLKKPKFDHLYHSKGVPLSNNHKYLGPGQYQIKDRTFNLANTNEKYQFFGSTQVRFKEKVPNLEKGYSLLEMIKQNRKLSKQRRTPYKKIDIDNACDQIPIAFNPGPGQYDPNDQVSKKSRGAIFFPLQERFKSRYEQNTSKEGFSNQDIQFLKPKEKNVITGNLKKQRFKPMHKCYNPVKQQQICGILSQKSQMLNTKQNWELKNNKSNDIAQLDNQVISSWSRSQKRIKDGSYLKQLKYQLAEINTPLNTDQQGKKRLSKQKKAKKQQ